MKIRVNKKMLLRIKVAASEKYWRLWPMSWGAISELMIC